MAQKYPYIDDTHNPASNPFHSLLNDFDQFGVAASSDFHISGISTFSGTSAFTANVQIKSGLKDATGDLGDSGQILASTGSGINWINANTTSVANASNVGTNLNSTDASQFIAFLGANSGNNPIRVDTDLTYNPSTNVLSVPSITMSSHLNIDGNIRSVAGNLELQAVSGENGLVIKDNNAVELYFDGSATYKLATKTDGIDVRGELETDTLKVTGNSALQGDVDLGTDADNTVTFNADIDSNLIPKTTQSHSLGASGAEWDNLWVQDIKVSGSITDKDSSTGSSGQVLSSTGTQVDWINVGDISAGSASQVAITDNSADASQFVNFTSAKSGNNAVRANDSLRYNPSNGTLSATTFSGALSGNASSATVATNAQGLTGTPSISITGLTISGSITDKDSSTGTSGQVLSSTGSQVDWVNVGDLSAGSASQVAISDDSNADAARFVTFVDSSSGNNAVKSDGQLKYNPSTNQLTAGSFNGSMAASNIDSGTLSADRIPSLASSKIASGTLGTARIPDLAASKIVSGTLGTARIPDLAASKITSGTLTDARIPSLNASKINAGTFTDARIPSLAASKITSGTFATGRIPNLDASKITSGTLDRNTTGNAATSTKAYVTESNTDSINRGLVFCDAANNASGNKDLKYDRNLVYNANSNTLFANNFQGTLGNFTNVDGAVKIRTDNGDAYHNILFVDSTTDNQYQTIKMDDEASRLQWNPNDENLVAYTTQTQGLRQWSDGGLGSSGQVLTSGGSGSQWTWQTPSTSSGGHMAVFTSNGTFNPPADTSTYIVWCTAGGGGSGAAKGEFDDSSISAYSGAGGGGGTAVRRYNSGEMGSSASVTVGSGGSPGTSGGSGSQGGHTQFNPNGTGATLSAWGGGGSSAANETTTNGGGGGSTQNGAFYINGQGGGRGGSNKDSEGSNGNITQGGQAYWGDNGYGRGADGVNRTSDGWQNGATGASGICIVYSF